MTAESGVEIDSLQEYEGSLLVAWLGFVEQDFASAGDMSDDRLTRMRELTAGVVVDPD